MLPGLPVLHVFLFADNHGFGDAARVNNRAEAVIVTQVIQCTLWGLVQGGKEAEIVPHGFHNLFAYRGFAYGGESFKYFTVFAQGAVNLLNIFFVPAFNLIIIRIATVGIAEFFVEAPLQGFATFFTDKPFC